MKQIRVSVETHKKLKMLATEKEMSFDKLLQWFMKVTNENNK